MNVLQALFFPPEQPGGVSSMVPYVKERFNEMGWQMDLFSMPSRIRNKGSDPLPFRKLNEQDYSGEAIADKYIQTFRDYIWWAKMRLQDKHYDIIHAHHPIAALTMKMLYPNTPVIATIHSSYERELLLNQKMEANCLSHQFLTAIYREMELAVDRIVTVSRSFQSYLTPHLEHPERVEVLPNGYDEKRFRPIAHQNHIPQLISVCRLVPAKGLDVLLEACSIVKKQGFPFVLHLIGDGPSREALQNMAEAKGIYDDTIFYGYLLHPEQFMPFFDVFVLPSRAEAFGSVFAEAALCKLALVGTDIGGIAEQITNGENGLLVPVDDANALADALIRLIKNPEERFQFAERAWQHASENYTMKRVLDRLSDIYLQTANMT